MSSVIISGDTSGAITVSAPLVAGTNTLTLQAATATSAVNTRATAVASTSGTSIDFASLPSWIKRITVMFSGVSTNGSSFIQVQIGSGSVSTSGYSSETGFGTTFSAATSGFAIQGMAAASTKFGHLTLTHMGSNLWASSHVVGDVGSALVSVGGGAITLGGTLDRVRITTVNGTDTFDAGSVNILYEG
jgi:hypothetical protein